MTKNTNKIQKNILLPIGVLFLIFIIILTYRNILLKNNIKEIQNPIITDKDINENTSSNFNTNELLVITGEQGLWDKERKSKIELIHELSIGGEESEKIFYRAGPVKADYKGYIYVAETWTEGTIKKYDPHGNYILSIGKKGKGPGELFGSCNFIFEEDTILTVVDAGTQRISRFNCNGNYLNSIQLEFKEIQSPPVFKGFVIDDVGNFFLSFYDFNSNKVIHKFNYQGEYKASFGKPFKIKDPYGVIALSLRTNNAPGRLAINKNNIFFSQSNPYEIRKYGVNGDLKMKIIRKNSFMPPDQVRIKGTNTYSFKIPSHSTLIGIWQKILINCVWVPPYVNDKIGAIVDIFNLDGELLTSITLKDNIYFYYLDQQGKIYGIESSNYSDERIVRYAIKLF